MPLSSSLSSSGRQALSEGLLKKLPSWAGRPNMEVWPFQSSVASEMEAVFLRQSPAHLLAERPVKPLAVVLALSRTALSEYWELFLWQDPVRGSWVGSPPLWLHGCEP